MSKSSYRIPRGSGTEIQKHEHKILNLRQMRCSYCVSKRDISRVSFIILTKFVTWSFRSRKAIQLASFWDHLSFGYPRHKSFSLLKRKKNTLLTTLTIYLWFHTIWIRFQERMLKHTVIDSSFFLFFSNLCIYLKLCVYYIFLSY